MIDLFCLPFAGGNKYAFREFERLSPPYLNLIPIEYPGRGSRSNEPLLSDINLLAEDVYMQIERAVGVRRYSIFGHSMGGLLGYLVARKLSAAGKQSPLHLFVTGTSGPSALSREEKKRHLLGNEEFMDELIKMNKKSEEVIRNEELFEYLEPMLRADFKASETYVYIPAEPLNIPITVITGTEEEMEQEDIDLWQKETCEEVDFRQMPGDHFFILDHVRELIAIFANKLSRAHKMYNV